MVVLRNFPLTFISYIRLWVDLKADLNLVLYSIQCSSLSKSRLTLINSSFFPSTLCALNSLDLENRNAPSYFSFKGQLVNKTLVPVWYSTGVRKWNIIHTKLRYNYSILNYDLLRFNLKDNPGCACGFECENLIHFFLECPINEHIRNTLFLILQIYGAIDRYNCTWKRKLKHKMLIFLQQFKRSYVIVIGLIDCCWCYLR